jgi:hypothetical protein
VSAITEVPAAGDADHESREYVAVPMTSDTAPDESGMVNVEG